MKTTTQNLKRFLIAFLLLAFFSFSAKAQISDSLNYRLPSATLKKLDGTSINTIDITNQGKPIILIFWKSCCTPNINMLDEINEVYTDWQKEFRLEIYAISIDDSRTSSKVLTLVNGKAWDFNVLLDVNSDFKRLMGVIATPHVFIINGNEIVWQKSTYEPGEASEIYEFLIKLNK